MHARSFILLFALAVILPLVYSTPGGLATSHQDAATRPQEVTGDIVQKGVLTLEGAKRVVEAAAAKAKAGGAGGAIAVVDDGGHLICLHRLTGTFPAASEVAYGKARTAAIFRMPTQRFENAIREGRHSLTAVGVMTPLEGGVPIVVNGDVVGAIGVSGANSSAQDVEIAEAGLQALEGRIR